MQARGRWAVVSPNGCVAQIARRFQRRIPAVRRRPLGVNLDHSTQAPNLRGDGPAERIAVGVASPPTGGRV